MKMSLNADLGESIGDTVIGNDAAMLDIVSSANLACGFHGGDPVVMQNTVTKAKARGVSIGAHPGYDDKEGFGRRPMTLTQQELTTLMWYQMGALAAISHAGGHPMTHVKPHGALNNQACADRDMADVLCRAIADFDRDLILLAPAESHLLGAGRDAGLAVAAEIFADRAYLPDGQLMPRTDAGAVLHDPTDAATHVERMLDAGGVVAADGTVLPCDIQSICVHGDGVTGVETAAAIRGLLLSGGHDIVPIADLIG